MKKLIFLVYLISLSLLGFAQTKAETTNWILSKFKKWKVIDTRIGYSELGTVIGGTSEIPLSLSFLNCNLIFKSNLSYIASSGSYEEITYSFNFGDVDNIEWVKLYNNDLLIISTRKNLVKSTSISKSKYSFEENNNRETSTKYIDRCIIAFNTNGEDDFKSRMLKALNHLKTFCSPTKRQKEAF
jgi:hypothetical protein